MISAPYVQTGGEDGGWDEVRRACARGGAE
jgi:hypothetical protein